MVGSAAIKQGRSANRKHALFFFCLSGSYNVYIVPNQSFSFIAAVLRYHQTIFNNDMGCVRQLLCSAHDRISEKVNLKVCCFESSKQKQNMKQINTIYVTNGVKPIHSWIYKRQ